MSEKDLELLITLDAPEEVEDDPHYQLDSGDTGIDNLKPGQITEQKLFNSLVGTKTEIE